jgi:hypothetical protein
MQWIKGQSRRSMRGLVFTARRWSHKTAHPNKTIGSGVFPLPIPFILCAGI